MKEIFKTLKKYSFIIVFIIFLLAIQAYCDLKLPEVTSKIVDIGIQQKGIEYAVPEVIREEEYNKIHINSTSNSLKYVINFSILGIKPETFVHSLEEHNIFISTKSACSSNDSISSSVYALTKNRDYALSSLRISFSYMNTIDEVDRFLDVFDKCYNKLMLK